MRRSTQRNQNRRAQRPTRVRFSRFGQKKLLALRVEFGGAREREFAAIRTNALSKNGLALLAVPRRLPFANVQNQDAWTSKRARERDKHRSAF
jgi:hypothetical protein